MVVKNISPRELLSAFAPTPRAAWWRKSFSTLHSDVSSVSLLLLAWVGGGSRDQARAESVSSELISPVLVGQEDLSPLIKPSKFTYGSALISQLSDGSTQDSSTQVENPLAGSIAAGVRNKERLPSEPIQEVNSVNLEKAKISRSAYTLVYDNIPPLPASAIITTTKTINGTREDIQKGFAITAEAMVEVKFSLIQGDVTLISDVFMTGDTDIYTTGSLSGLSSLKVGDYSLFIISKDAAGNISESRILGMVEPPVSDIELNINQQTGELDGVAQTNENSVSLSIKGDASQVLGLTSTGRKNGSIALPPTTLDASGIAVVALPKLPDDQWTITATPSLGEKNQTPAIYTFNVDTTLPEPSQVTITNDTDLTSPLRGVIKGFTFVTDPNNTITFSLTTKEGQNVSEGRVEANALGVATSGVLAFNAGESLVAGEAYNLEVTTSDSASNRVMEDHTVVVLPPLALSIDGSKNGFTNNPSPSLLIQDNADAQATLTGSNNFGIKLEPQSVVLDDSGFAQVQLNNLLSGTWVITVAVAEQTRQLEFTVDTQASAATATITKTGNQDRGWLSDLSQEGLTFTGEPGTSISFSLKRSNGTVLKMQQGLVIGDSGTVDTGGLGSFVTDGSRSFTYSLEITSTDPSENTITSTKTLSIFSDSWASVFLSKNSDSGQSNRDRITHETSPTFVIEGEPDSLIMLELIKADGTRILLPETTLDSKGMESVELSSDIELSDGEWSINAVSEYNNFTARILVDTQVQPLKEVTIGGKKGLVARYSEVGSLGLTFVPGEAGTITYEVIHNAKVVHKDSISTNGEAVSTGIISAFAEGAGQTQSYTLKTTFQDIAGNRSNTSTDYRIILQQEEPLNVMYIGGSGNAFEITGSATDTLSLMWVSTQDNAIAAGEEVKTLVLDSTGMATLVTMLKDGVWKLTVTSEGEAFTMAFTIDTTPPSVPQFRIGNDRDLEGSAQSISLEGFDVMGEADSHVFYTLHQDKNIIAQGTLTLDAQGEGNSGALTLLNDQTIESGQEYSLTVRSADDYGNSTSPVVLTVNVTMREPLVVKLNRESDTGVSDQDNLTKDTTPTIGIWGDINSRVNLQLVKREGPSVILSDVVLTIKDPAYGGDGVGYAQVELPMIDEGQWFLLAMSGDQQAQTSFAVDTYAGFSTIPRLVPTNSVIGGTKDNVSFRGFELGGYRGSTHTYSFETLDGEVIAKGEVVFRKFLVKTGALMFEAGKTLKEDTIYNIVVTPMDSAGNAREENATYFVLPNVQEPSLMLIIYSDYDSGTLYDAITNKNGYSTVALIVSGSRSSKPTFVLTSPEKTRFFTQELNSDGLGVVSLASDVDGQYILKSILGDKQGTYTFTIDTVAPRIPTAVVSNDNDLVATKESILEGFTFRGEANAVLTYTLTSGDTDITNGSLMLDSTGVMSSGRLNIAQDLLMVGEKYTLSVTITDIADNSNTESFTVEVKQERALDIMVSLTPNGVTLSNFDHLVMENPTFDLSGNPNAVIEITATLLGESTMVPSVTKMQTITLDNDGKYALTFTRPLTEGRWKVEAKTDIDGSDEAHDVVVSVDQQAPMVVMAYLSGNDHDLEGRASYVIKGFEFTDGEAYATVAYTLEYTDPTTSTDTVIAQGRVTLDASGVGNTGYLKGVSSLNEGSYQLMGYVQDQAGNQSLSFDYRVDVISDDQLDIVLDESVDTGLAHDHATMLNNLKFTGFGKEGEGAMVSFVSDSGDTVSHEDVVFDRLGQVDIMTTLTDGTWTITLVQQNDDRVSLIFVVDSVPVDITSTIAIKSDSSTLSLIAATVDTLAARGFHFNASSTDDITYTLSDTKGQFISSGHNGYNQDASLGGPLMLDQGTLKAQSFYDLEVSVTDVYGNIGMSATTFYTLLDDSLEESAKASLALKLDVGSDSHTRDDGVTSASTLKYVLVGGKDRNVVLEFFNKDTGVLDISRNIMLNAQGVFSVDGIVLDEGNYQVTLKYNDPASDDNERIESITQQIVVYRQAPKLPVVALSGITGLTGSATHLQDGLSIKSEPHSSLMYSLSHKDMILHEGSIASTGDTGIVHTNALPSVVLEDIEPGYLYSLEVTARDRAGNQSTGTYEIMTSLEYSLGIHLLRESDLGAVDFDLVTSAQSVSFAIMGSPYADARVIVTLPSQETRTINAEFNGSGAGVVTYDVPQGFSGVIKLAVSSDALSGDEQVQEASQEVTVDLIAPIDAQATFKNDTDLIANDVIGARYGFVIMGEANAQVTYSLRANDDEELLAGTVTLDSQGYGVTTSLDSTSILSLGDMLLLHLSSTDLAGNTAISTPARVSIGSAASQAQAQAQASAAVSFDSDGGDEHANVSQEIELIGVSQNTGSADGLVDVG